MQRCPTVARGASNAVVTALRQIRLAAAFLGGTYIGPETNRLRATAKKLCQLDLDTLWQRGQAFTALRACCLLDAPSEGYTPRRVWVPRREA